VSTNACLDEMRRRQRRPVPLDEERHPLQERPDPRAPSVGASVADRMTVDDALGSIAPEFRACVVLRDLCDLDYAEIADILDLRPGTVRSRIARGRAALARVLRGERPGPRRPPAAPSSAGNQTGPGDVQPGGDP
jgi:RNA polymerase sigma-70 factor (ECF subfamily)